MDLSIIRHYIKNYKDNFAIVNSQEIYKWKAIKIFQNNWDLLAKDFFTMISNSLDGTINLLDSGNYFPRRMLLQNTQKASEEIRRLFGDLYNEDEDLLKRIIDFKDSFNKLNKVNYPGKKSYQDDRAILVYLTLRYPDRYYFYKYELFKAFTKKTNYHYLPKRGRSENIGHYQNMCSIIENELLADKDLIRLHKNRLSEDCYTDEKFKVLTQDFVYAVVFHLNNLDYSEKAVAFAIEVGEQKASDIILNEQKIDFTTRLLNNFENDKENKRIGDLGEHWVIEYEKNKLNKLGLTELAKIIVHISKEKGDGAGYDIQSFDEKKNKIYIEVKTTKCQLSKAFFVSRNELEKSRIEGSNYYLYRIYDFDENNRTARLRIINGDLSCICNNPVMYKINIKGKS